MYMSCSLFHTYGIVWSSVLARLFNTTNTPPATAAATAHQIINASIVGDRVPPRPEERFLPLSTILNHGSELYPSDKLKTEEVIESLHEKRNPPIVKGYFIATAAMVLLYILMSIY
jgi:hypothetical protein